MCVVIFRQGAIVLYFPQNALRYGSLAQRQLLLKNICVICETRFARNTQSHGWRKPESLPINLILRDQRETVLQKHRSVIPELTSFELTSARSAKL